MGEEPNLAHISQIKKKESKFHKAEKKKKARRNERKTKAAESMAKKQAAWEERLRAVKAEIGEDIAQMSMARLRGFTENFQSMSMLTPKQKEYRDVAREMLKEREKVASDLQEYATEDLREIISTSDEQWRQEIAKSILMNRHSSRTHDHGDLLRERAIIAKLSNSELLTQLRNCDLSYEIREIVRREIEKRQEQGSTHWRAKLRSKSPLKLQRLIANPTPEFSPPQIAYARELYEKARQLRKMPVSHFVDILSLRDDEQWPRGLVSAVRNERLKEVETEWESRRKAVQEGRQAENDREKGGEDLATRDRWV